jgi:hypothetical protein
VLALEGGPAPRLRRRLSLGAGGDSEQNGDEHHGVHQ